MICSVYHKLIQNEDSRAVSRTVCYKALYLRCPVERLYSLLRASPERGSLLRPETLVLTLSCLTTTGRLTLGFVDTEDFDELERAEDEVEDEDDEREDDEEDAELVYFDIAAGFLLAIVCVCQL